MSDLKQTNLTNDDDIMAVPEKKGFHPFGRTRKAKIINIGSIVVLIAVIIWCVVGQ